MFDSASVRAWISQKAQLSAIKKQELATRKGLIQQFFGATPRRGTTHQLVAQDLELTIMQNYAYRVTRNDIQQIMDQLTDEDKIAINWVPEIIPSVFRALPDNSVLRRIVVVKPSTPSLTALDLSVK